MLVGVVDRAGGDIITVTSGIGFMPFPLMPTYGASKAGVHSYTESLRAQLAGTGVTVTELVVERAVGVGITTEPWGCTREVGAPHGL